MTSLRNLADDAFKRLRPAEKKLVAQRQFDEACERVARWAPYVVQDGKRQMRKHGDVLIQISRTG